MVTRLLVTVQVSGTASIIPTSCLPPPDPCEIGYATLVETNVIFADIDRRKTGLDRTANKYPYVVPRLYRHFRC